MSKKENQRITHVPYRYWKLRHRIIERLYRWTHGGQIRTLVVQDQPDWSDIAFLEGDKI